MLFAWFRICPNEEFPSAELASAAHCTMLNGFKSSRRSETVARSGRFTCFAADMLNELRKGDRTPGSVRGALPNVFLGTAWKAARLKYWLSVVFVSRRDVMSPSATISWPSTRLGRIEP